MKEEYVEFFKSVKRSIIISAIFVVWTLMVAYGCYHNTTTHAELLWVTEDSYQIVYHNTGDIMDYSGNVVVCNGLKGVK